MPNSNCSSGCTAPASCSIERSVGERPGDALGHPGSARGVEHVEAGDPGFVERLRRLLRDGGLVALVAVDRAVEHQTQFDVRRRPDVLGGLVGLVLRGDVGPGAAVVDDVLEFVGS